MSRIRNYVENMFSGYPDEENNRRLKEEIIASMEDKYEYFLRDGLNSEEALGKVFSEFGSIYELEDEIVKYKSYESERNIEYEENLIDYNSFMKLFPYLISLPILLFIVATGAFVALEDSLGGNISLLIFLIAIGIGVSILVIAGMKKANYERILGIKDEDQGINLFEVDESSELTGIDGFIWLIATAVFLIGGFLYNAWEVSWIAFIIAGAIQSLIKGIEGKFK